MSNAAVDHVAGSLYLFINQIFEVRLALLGQYGKWPLVMENHRCDLKGYLGPTC